MKKLIFLASTFLLSILLWTHSNMLSGEPRQRTETWPIGFSQTAYDLSIDGGGHPRLHSVSTRLPVMDYVGHSADNRYIAYTALDAFDEKVPNNRKMLRRSETTTGVTLVPSGNLYIEDSQGKILKRVSAEDQFVVAASWSPVTPNFLSYLFSSGSTTKAAVVDVESGDSTVLDIPEVHGDSIAWAPDGRGIQVLVEEPDLAVRENGYEISRFRAAQFVPGAYATEENIVDLAPGFPHLDTAKATTSPQSFSVSLPGGMKLRGDNILGVSLLSLITATGEVATTTSADKIIAVTPAGVAYRVVKDGQVIINFLTTTGTSIPLLSKVTVTYKLPFASGLGNPTVTQGGGSYSTKCNIYDHTASSSMAYAYDIQGPIGKNEYIIASAAGTVAYLYKSVTCNTLDSGSDGTKCPDYNSACADSNGGWGNTVILYHADGYWTKYAHLRYGSVLPSKTGVSVAMGCQIGTQGHTGATTGTGNKCGDHLHFQRQNSSSRSGTSVSITFSDTSNPLKCTTYTSGNSGKSCNFL